MDLTQRLKQVRESLGLSQRELAQKLGITGTAWQHYETGQNIPGGKVLTTLGQMGIDLNWLLLGLGEMQARRNKASRGAGRRELERGDTAGEKALLSLPELDELRVMGSTSRIAEEYSVHTVLTHRYPEPCTQEEIISTLADRGIPLDRQQLTVLLALLRRRGLAVEVPGEPVRYRASDSRGDMVAKDITGHSNLLLRSISTLVQDVFPRAVPPQGGLLHLRLTTDREKGKALIERLRSLIKEECIAATVDQGEDEAVVILGMAHIQL